MTNNEQQEIRRKIWDIANNVRGAVDGWEFKQYVRGTLFYRFISENFVDHIEAGAPDVNYAQLDDSVISPEIKDDAVKTKGFLFTPANYLPMLLKTPKLMKT